MMYNESSRIGKNDVVISASAKEINDYTDRVRKRQVDCILGPCFVCGLQSRYFKHHDTRDRKYNVVVEQIVKVVCALIIRWKCPGCGKTYTQYPEFALPHKRYTLPTLMHFCAKYTENKDTTYRKLTVDTALGYQNSEKQLDHSTVHRWITSLGRLKKTIALALDLISQTDACMNIFRESANLNISSKKYRSFERKMVLQSCRRLFLIEARYRITFGFSIFPKLATDCRFG